ncbi:MAG TPA: TolC family protein, partial [Verrucomicrobiae bacterium]|nr:TolC family protein [Verrucomicrobiae bacterium]
MQIAVRNRLFDESKRMSHSSSTMKWLGVFLLAVASGFSGLAQTATISGTDTNGAGVVYSEMTNSLAADTNAPANIRMLSLQDCIELALKHNLELQVDRYNPAISLYTLKAAYGGYDPTLFLSGSHEHNNLGEQLFGNGLLGGSTEDVTSFDTRVSGTSPIGTTYSIEGQVAGTDQFLTSTNGTSFNPNTSGQVRGSISQPLLKNFWIDQTRLNIRVDKNRLKYTQLGLKLNIMTTVTTLEQAYYDLIYNRENVKVQEMAAQQTDRLVLESKKKLEVGALAELDLASAQAQAAQNRAAIIQAESQLGTQERKVKGLITDNFPQWADVELQPSGNLTAERVAFNRQESWRKALADRPEYLQAKLDAEKQGIQLKYDWNQIFPELDVVGTAGYNGSGTFFSEALFDVEQRNRPFYSFGGQLTVPLANINARNTYKSDKVSLQQFLLTIKEKERDILIAIDNDIGTLQADYDNVQATHAQRLYEEQALDAEQKKLNNGKSTTYNVILVQRDLTTARGAEIQALDTYNKDLAQFSLDEGSTLERLNIDLTVK